MSIILYDIHIWALCLFLGLFLLYQFGLKPILFFGMKNWPRKNLSKYNWFNFYTLCLSGWMIFPQRLVIGTPGRPHQFDSFLK